MILVSSWVVSVSMVTEMTSGGDVVKVNMYSEVEGSDVCVCVYVCVCMCVRMYVYVCACVHVCVSQNRQYQLSLSYQNHVCTWSNILGAATKAAG